MTVAAAAIISRVASNQNRNRYLEQTRECR